MVKVKIKSFFIALIILVFSFKSLFSCCCSGRRFYFRTTRSVESNGQDNQLPGSVTYCCIFLPRVPEEVSESSAFSYDESANQSADNTIDSDELGAIRCSVCTKKYSETRKKIELKCGHSFCRKCLIKWGASYQKINNAEYGNRKNYKKATCPTCREMFRKDLLNT